MGMGLINSGPELEAARIESESGILTRAGRDGFTWSVSGREWVKSGKSAGGKSNGESAKKPAGGQKRLGE